MHWQISRLLRLVSAIQDNAINCLGSQLLGRLEKCGCQVTEDLSTLACSACSLFEGTLFFIQYRLKCLKYRRISSGTTTHKRKTQRGKEVSSNEEDDIKKELEMEESKIGDYITVNVLNSLHKNGLLNGTT